MHEGPCHDVVVIGGGIVGLATAKVLAETGNRSVLLLEAEAELARHQTGHNSGVIHSGLYYRPGSLKARNCAEGRDRLYRFCAEHGIAHERCGKVVVATDARQESALSELERRGKANGLSGLHRLSREALLEREPHVAGGDALLVPQTGIVDFAEVAAVYAERVRMAGGTVLPGRRVTAVTRSADRFRLSTPRGPAAARIVVNCAGLQADRVARLCGLRPAVRIVPFRGEYYVLKPEKRHLVAHLIYPVPDPRFPFLGVHFTRMVHGGVEAGPNAVLSFHREGYSRRSFSAADTLNMFSYGGFWRMAARHWRTAVAETRRSWSKRAFVRGLQQLVPEVGLNDVEPGGVGVRAQAVRADGALLDDFLIEEAPGMVHVLNAPSPAATASLSIGKKVAGLVAGHLDRL